MLYSLQGKEVLIIGGTGSLGSTLAKKFIAEQEQHKLKGLRIYSRDEFKQFHLQNELAGSSLPIAFLIGDVRDYNRLYRAMQGVDIVINAAAMKQVPACEDNPLEAVKTNIDGATHIINAAINTQINYVLHISTDKAVYPINLYGATKTVAEKLFLHANIYSPHTTKFACCRYGNVLASRGSLVPLLKEQFAKTGTVTLTHKDMTRFFIKLSDVAQFIVDSMLEIVGGEIFIPKMKSMKIIDVIKAVVPDAAITTTGIRPGEKLHEVLISSEEMKHIIEFKDRYKILPQETGRLIELQYYGSHQLHNPEFLAEPKQVQEFLQQQGVLS